MNITLHLTTACQLRCRYCYAAPGEHKRLDMTPELAREAVEFAARQSPEHCGIVFFGGEPFLLPKLVREIVAYCRAREKREATRFHFKATTNGIGLSEELLDWAAAEDIFIAISLDGVRAAHDANRVWPDGRGTWLEVDRAATELLRRRPYSPVMLVVAPETVAHYAESVEYLLKKGFRYLIASLNYAGDWTPRALRELKKQYQRLAKLYEEWTREERKFYFSPFEVKLASHIHGEHFQQERCELGRRQLSVGPDGGVWPCVQFVQGGGESPFRIGDIWRGVDAERQRVLAEHAEVEHAVCAECAVNRRCNHTCGCLNWQTTGDIHQVSPVLCAHERLLLPIVDRLGERLYKERSALFIQKHYNAMYPILSLIEDEESGAAAAESARAGDPAGDGAFARPPERLVPVPRPPPAKP